MSKKRKDFEGSLKKLEEIVSKLEDGELSLEESLKLFEEGIGLSRDCQKHLEEAERRIEVLIKDASGDPLVEAFEESTADSGEI